MKIKNNSKEFILDFFRDNQIKDENGVLTISEVSKDFEDFIGKKAPYKLVFDFELHKNIKDSELIMQGSYFLLAIRDYLSDKGQTSLLKLNFLPDMDKFKKYKITEFKTNNFGFISEFSFLSSYQYLNEKKQSINRILVKDKKILDLDITKFKKQTGQKDEISNWDLSKEYLIAKDKISKLANNETKSIKVVLSEKINKELNRVKEHYFKQIKEKDEEVERCTEKIKLLQSKLKHTYYDRDIRILNGLIRESEERLVNLKKKSYKERLKAEEKFHITDEIEKHGLSIKHSLINVTLYYYPIYSLSVNSKGKKKIIFYDPLFEKKVSSKISKLS